MATIFFAKNRSPAALEVAPVNDQAAEVKNTAQSIRFVSVGAAFPIAIAIRLDSPGPLFFRQVRYAYRGRPFYIWKFRSMVFDADARQHTVENEANGLIFKDQFDPRVTRIGRFLRRTSLDKIP